MKKEITISDVRVVLDELLDLEGRNEVAQMTDEELLNCNFREDLLMDSLEIIESVMIMEKDFDIRVPDSAYDHFKDNGGTVRALLDEINLAINA